MLEKLENKPQSIDSKGLTGDPPPMPILNIPGRFTNIKHAKRAMGKLISEFIKGNIKNQDAKDLAYLISIYITVLKDAEIEERIKKLEEKIQI